MSDLFAYNIRNGFLKRFFLSLPQHSHWVSLRPSERFWKMLWSCKLCYRLKLSRRQHDHCPAILQVPRTQNKLYEPHLGNTKSLRGTNESHLGNEKPVTGIIQPHLGITKPTEGLNMPCLRNEFGRRYMYFTTQVKTPITGQTCAKAVAILYRGEKPRTSVLHDKYYLSIAFNGSFHTVERFDVGFHRWRSAIIQRNP